MPLPSQAPAVRLSRGAVASAAAATPDVKDTRFCPKHPQQRVTEQCRVCGKGICPLCMQLFGYVCSPHCKEKAELQGMEIPQFAGQRDQAERAKWGKRGLFFKIAAVFGLLLLGVWFWYAWFGQRPKQAFKVRFEDEPAMSGGSAVCPENQIIFIHGAKLARYDLKTKKEVWLVRLVDKKKIEAEAAKIVKEVEAEAAANTSEFPIKVPNLGTLIKELVRHAEESLQLRVHGKNVWVADGENARRFDWATGDLKETVALTEVFGDGVMRGDEMQFKEQVDSGRINVTRFNLVSGKVQREEIGESLQASETATNKFNPLLAAMLAKKSGGNPKGGLGGISPHQLAAAVANAPLAGKLAAPATISVARRQQEALDEMETMDGENSGAAASGWDSAKVDSFERSSLFPTATGFIQMKSKMTERNFVSHSAMKAPPKKSALDGPVNAAATMDIANELLNEMARNAGADKVSEDLSKYHVKIHVGGGGTTTDWEKDVVGAPRLYPQTTVHVVTGDKKIYVLDAQGKFKWESTLNFPMAGGGSFLEMDEAEQTGLGPVVERGDTLYVYDQGVLSAFELATGNPRWRLPSVGITGMFFDDLGKIYLNTTTASPDKIKYSRQINVMDNTADVVLKLDPKNGKEIWRHAMGGQIAYLSGKYIYTLSYLPPLDEDEEVDENLAALGLQSKPYLRIRRISPSNGRVLWDYFEQRGALDVKIHDNTFQIVMKKEVQLLKFLSF